MEGSDKDIKKALDDIFGDDVIEIDTSSTTDEAKQEELSKTYLNIPLEESSEINIPDVSETNDETYDEIKDDNNIKNDNDDYTDNSDIATKDSKNNKLDIKKIIIYFIIGFIIGITLIYVIVNYVVGKEKVVNCSYTAEDVGYKVTDEYKITYKNNEILYVESTYNYEAKTDEYKNQIEYIKDDEIITSGHGYQSLRDSLSENTIIEVKNSKIYMTLEFTDSQYSLIDNIRVTVDGKTTNFEKSSDKKYTVELESLDSNIQLSYNVNIPIPNMPPHDFTVNVKLAETP